MRQLVFMLEEPSMRELLEGLLPRLLPGNVEWLLIAHEGKTDLRHSIPRKLRAWGDPEARFIIVHDQDSNDCKKLKRDLFKLCVDAGRRDTLIRIVCRELESWLLGDLAAVERAYEMRGLARHQEKARFRDPERLGYSELKRLVPRYQKVLGARMVGRELGLEDNRAASFGVFLRGVLATAGGSRRRGS